MIEIFRKKFGLTIRELYFAPDIVESSDERDIDHYVQCHSPINGSKSFWTSIVDLQQDEQTIFNTFGKTLRTEIRRAADCDRDGLVVDVNLSPSPKDMAFVKSFYNEFASFKGIEKVNMPKLEIFRQSGCLSISTVYRSHERLPLAMNCDIYDADRGRGYYGATPPRNGVDSDDKRLIGRANKLLQWQTMLTLKNLGVKFYDFGGISRSTDLQGVDAFKRQFGGVETQEYNALFGISKLGDIALKASKLISRFNMN